MASPRSPRRDTAASASVLPSASPPAPSPSAPSAPSASPPAPDPLFRHCVDQTDVLGDELTDIRDPRNVIFILDLTSDRPHLRCFAWTDVRQIIEQQGTPPNERVRYWRSAPVTPNYVHKLSDVWLDPAIDVLTELYNTFIIRSSYEAEIGTYYGASSLHGAVERIRMPEPAHRADVRAFLEGAITREELLARVTPSFYPEPEDLIAPAYHRISTTAAFIGEVDDGQPAGYGLLWQRFNPPLRQRFDEPLVYSFDIIYPSRRLVVPATVNAFGTLVLYSNDPLPRAYGVFMRHLYLMYQGRRVRWVDGTFTPPDVLPARVMRALTGSYESHRRQEQRSFDRMREPRNRRAADDEEPEVLPVCALLEHAVPPTLHFYEDGDDLYFADAETARVVSTPDLLDAGNVVILNGILYRARVRDDFTLHFYNMRGQPVDPLPAYQRAFSLQRGHAAGYSKSAFQLRIGGDLRYQVQYNWRVRDFVVYDEATGHGGLPQLPAGLADVFLYIGGRPCSIAVEMVDGVPQYVVERIDGEGALRDPNDIPIKFLNTVRPLVVVPAVAVEEEAVMGAGNVMDLEEEDEDL